MPWDGSGNIQRTNGTNSGTTVWQDDRDDGVNIRADRHDTHDEDLAGALENTVALDGQTTTTTDNSLLWYNGPNNAFEGFEVVASRIVGRKASGDVGALTPAEGRTVLGLPPADPEHATDGGTDAYVSATNTTPPAAGVTIVRDFQSANTTTTPTLDSLTITTRDGSALWAGALSGVHTLQYDATAGTWLVLDPTFGGPTALEVGKGAIVESGTNANGSYVRWENGEQVCFTERNAPIPHDNTAITGIGYTNETTWTFPATFTSAPIVNGTSQRGNNDTRKGWTHVIRHSATDADYVNVTTNPADLSYVNYLVAWGFWK